MRRPGALVLAFSVVFSAALAGCTGDGPAPLPIVTVFSSTSAAPSAARLAAQPLAGHAGGEFRLSGENYPAHGRVLFTFHGGQIGETTADAAGRFAGIPVRVPDSFGDSTPGTQFTIGATSGPIYAETTFVITR